VSGLTKIKPVKTVIAGCGGITPTVLRRIRDLDEFDFVALMDIDPDALNAVGDEFEISKRLTDYDALLNEDIELVIINTPNDCHHPQTIDALKSGVHCFVQKPIARNVNEAQEMVDAANDAGLLLGVVMLDRCDPIARQMRSMVMAGCFGQITVVRSILAHTNHLENPPVDGTWRSSPERIGGGSFIQLAVHHIDISQFILDQKVETVTALSSSFVKPENFPLDETTAASVKFSGGALGQFTSSFTTTADSIEILGTDGMIRRDEEGLTWITCELFSGELWDAGRVGAIHKLTYPEMAGKIAKLFEQYEPHRKFAHAIRGKSPVETPGELGVYALKIVEAAARSTAEFRTITID